MRSVRAFIYRCFRSSVTGIDAIALFDEARNIEEAIAFTIRLTVGAVPGRFATASGSNVVTQGCKHPPAI